MGREPRRVVPCRVISACQRQHRNQQSACLLPIRAAFLCYCPQARTRARLAGNRLQVEGDVARRLEALRRILFQAVTHDAVQPGREAGDDFLQFRGLFLEDGVQSLDARITLESPFAGEHLVKDGAEGEDVSAMVSRLSSHLLGRHVADGAQHLAGGCARLGMVHRL